MEESKVVHEWVKTDPAKKVKLSKMSKGHWQWEISFEAGDSRQLLDEIYLINDELLARFGDDSVDK